MFDSIVVGTDGSETASEAVRQATEMARIHGARVHVVSAYEPVGSARIREERSRVPDDMQWMVNPREDVEQALVDAAAAHARGRRRPARPTPARATRPTRSWTSPRSSAPS